jgi:membrane protein
MLSNWWNLIKTTAFDFMEDEALTRGAAIAYYTVFAIAPVLVIVIAIAGLAFGREAAEGAIVGQLQGLMGEQAASTVQAAVQSASSQKAGIWATVIGLVTLLVTASGIFTEMQAALNVIWKAEPKDSAVSRLVKARIASLGLVMALGFLMLVSLVVSAGLKAMGTWMSGLLPGWETVAQVLSFVISFALISVLFAAIYKVLPDKKIDWRDVITGAVATAFLFTIGKTLIGLYIGSSSIASSYGAAGALAILLLWIYYSAQIFLFGAEFTKVFAETHGSHAFNPARKAENAPAPAGQTPPRAEPAIPLVSTNPDITDLRDRLRAEKSGPL